MKASLTPEYLNEDDPLVEYRGNPLIGALGPPITRPEIRTLLTVCPPYEPSVRAAPSHLRIHAAHALRRLFIPAPPHEAVVQEIDILMRQGYIHRNPLCKRYNKLIASDRPVLKRGGMPPERFLRVPLLGTAATGTFGTGKTEAFNIALSRYPQVINHCYERDGRTVAFRQVTYLQLNLYQDASLKALGIEFFDKLGLAIGEPIREQWGVNHCGANTIQPLIYLASREFNLGLLVIDEVQNMASHNKGFRVVLQYLTRMMNCLGLPIALIGANTARSLMTQDASAARRFIGSIPPFANFPNDKYWAEFLKEVWAYQYTATPTPITGLVQLMHDLTGGVPDLLIKLYLLTQMRLIGKRNETITAQSLRETASDLFYLIKDRLAELKGSKKEGARVAEVRSRLDERFAELSKREESRIVGASNVADLGTSDANAKIERKKSSVLLAADEAEPVAALEKAGLLDLSL